MMLSEAEAKTKWCPLVRVTMTGFAGGGRGPHPAVNRTDGVGTSCQGAACMFWRWGPARVVATSPHGHAGTVPEGYCGAAGVPFNSPRTPPP